MFHTTLLALVLATPGAQPEVLRSSSEANGAPEMEQTSTKWTQGGARGQTRVVDTVSHYIVGTGLVFTIDGLAKGTLPPPANRSSVLTMVRTTYRRTTDAYPQFVGDLVGIGAQYEHQCSIWQENAQQFSAFPGSLLEAKLIDGDEKGKVMVRCASAVTGDPTSGYVCTYTVENHTDKPVSFKWAGFEGRVEPGKSFTKSEPVKELTREESGLAQLDFGERREFALRANYWWRPK